MLRYYYENVFYVRSGARVCSVYVCILTRCYREEAEAESFHIRKQEKDSENIGFTKEMSALQIKHRESEAALRKRLNKMQHDVEDWIAKYDHVRCDKVVIGSLCRERLRYGHRLNLKLLVAVIGDYFARMPTQT